MTDRVSLDDINYALRKLTQMQLAGELTPEQAWQERQTVLDTAEANWAALAGGQRTEIAHDMHEQLAAPSRAKWQRALKNATRLPLWLWRTLGWGWLLLLISLATWLYIFNL